MATCKNCVHVEVCSYTQNSNNAFEHCANFRDRSRFVELPCNVGDIGYGLYRRRQKSGKVNTTIKSGRISEMRFNLNMDLIVTVHRIATGIVGKTVFISSEEAEQALKERENEY